MLGERLKFALDECDIRQKDFAEKLNVTQQAVSRWCQNITQPDNKTLVKIAQLLDVSIDYLLGNDENITDNDIELLEKLALRNALVKAGFMEKSDDLSDEELTKIMNFLVNNKDILKKHKD